MSTLTLQRNEPFHFLYDHGNADNMYCNSNRMLERESRLIMLEFKNPIPVITPHGNGYAIYVSNAGTWENDVWCVALCKGGSVRHYLTRDLRIYSNMTFNISKDETYTIEAS